VCRHLVSWPTAINISENHCFIHPLQAFPKNKSALCWVFPQKSGTGERRKSAAASPTKRIERNPIFEFERNEQLSTSAVGEAIASKPMLNTNVWRTGIKENKERYKCFQ